ncbi:SIMPL domain-containing protein [Streptomyces vilmorinianum]|uniref:SIMPL domain-containing protein n=1 Tax=Streptomyces vilmorinianum TaxID=3051092 RepID=UPI0020C75F3F|nr:SIMPL domain-containing protein [Streptomyces vilmorinianum]
MTTSHLPPHRLPVGPFRAAGVPSAVRPRPVRRAVTAGAVLAALLIGGAAPALAVAPGAAAPVTAAPATDPATITVTGSGRAAGAPDLAVLSVGVEATRKTAKEAMEAQRVAAEALLAALRKQSVADRDIRTDSLSLSPVHTYTADGQSKVTGYRAGQSFSAKIRDIDKAGQVIGAVTDATGDAGRINGVAFDIADPSALRAKARETAHKDAHDKAAQHARLSGHRLGRLVSLTESEGMRPGRPAPEMPADAPGVPLAPGEIEEQVTVTAVYELR